MTQRSELEENVYLLKDTQPKAEDADSNGNVLYFCASYGWYSGYWQKPHMQGTTHWTYLPYCPPALEDSKVVSDRKYQEWMRTFPAEFDPAANSLIRLGWNAAWERAN